MNVQNRVSLYGTTAMTAAERGQGRFMRAPDHPGAPAGFETTGTPNQEQNNQGGNSAQPNGESNNQNNSGEEFDAASFWNEEGDSDDALPNRDSASESGGSPSTGNQTNNNSQQPPSFADQLLTGIDGLTFEGVFSEEIANQINQGDFKGANEAIQNNLRSAVKQSMLTNVQLLRKFGETMTNQVKNMIQESMTGQKQTDALTQAIPSASNPKVGPAIRAIYEQALTRTKGNTEKAIGMTKSMMATLSRETATDIDFEVAPRDPHSSRQQVEPTNWLEELAGR